MARARSRRSTGSVSSAPRPALPPRLGGNRRRGGRRGVRLGGGGTGISIGPPLTAFWAACSADCRAAWAAAGLGRVGSGRFAAASAGPGPRLGFPRRQSRRPDDSLARLSAAVCAAALARHGSQHLPPPPPMPWPPSPLSPSLPWPPRPPPPAWRSPLPPPSPHCRPRRQVLAASCSPPPCRRRAALNAALGASAAPAAAVSQRLDRRGGIGGRLFTAASFSASAALAASRAVVFSLRPESAVCLLGDGTARH